MASHPAQPLDPAPTAIPHPARARVVITGVGAVSPAGTDSKAHAAGLAAGRSFARSLTGGWWAPFRRAVVAPLARFGAADDPLPRHVEAGSRAVAEALDEAGLSSTERAAAGVVAATAIAASVELEATFRTGGRPRAEAFGFDILTAEIRRRYGLAADGWAPTVSTGCTAGLDALGVAHDAITAGHKRTVVVVAAEATACPIVVAAFDKIGALSSRDVPPHEASAPFSRQRDGFVLGEGAAALVLEDAASAAARGAVPDVEVAGWGTVSSAFHMTNIRSSGEDVAAAISRALVDAGVPADAIEALDAHGTSTKRNDTAESAAFHGVFGARADAIPVVAQKGVMGHALGASNLLEIAGLARYLPAGELPPTANTTTTSIDEPLDVVVAEPRQADVEWLAKTSSGFSGIHSAAIFRRL